MSPLVRRIVFATIIVGWTVLVSLVDPNAVYLPLSLFALVSVGVVVYVDRAQVRFDVTPRAIMIGLAGAAVMCGGTYGGFAAGSAMFPDLVQQVGRDYAATNVAGNWRVVPALAAIVLAEEVVWRGAMLGASDRPRPTAIALSIATYTLAQVGFGSGIVLLLAVVCGLFWTAERYLAKSVLAPLITHFVWNVVVLVAWPVT